MRRFLLITLITLVVLVTATTGIGWYLLQNESFLKKQLASLSLKFTGRQLDLTGPLTLDLGRETTLEANGIRFANAAWAEAPDMVAVGYLKISVEVASLFSDKPVFPSFEASDCKIVLVQNAEGKANWDMLQRSDPKPKPDKPPREDLPLWLKDLKITNCELDITTLKLKDPLNIGVASLAMQHHDDNRWTGIGSGRVNQQALSFDGWFAPFSAIVHGGPVKHELKLDLGQITLQSSGSMQDIHTGAGANITAEIKGPEIADILNEFKLPLFSEGAFDYRLSLNTEGKMTQVELDGDLGSLDIGAHGELDRLIRPTEGDIQFSVDGPNLGALARVFGLKGVVEKPFSHRATTGFGGDSLRIKQVELKTDSDVLQVSGHFGTRNGFSGTNLDVHFETDEAGAWTTLLGQPQQSLGPLTLDGNISSDANSLITLQAKATQQETSLDVDGTLGQLPDGFHPDLNVSLKSSDPSQLASVAGLDWIPAAPLAITGKFNMQGKQIRLGKMNINLAGDQADLDGVINLENRYAGSDINIKLDIRNAAGLGRLFGKEGLPDQPMQLSGEVKPEGKGLSIKVADGNLGKMQLDLEGRIIDLDQPWGMDGKFNINLPRLSDVSFLFPGKKLPDAPFAAHGVVDSDKSTIHLQKITVDLAGNQAKIDGAIKLTDRYAGSQLNFDLDIKSARDLARLFGQEGLPDEPWKMNAQLNPRGKGLEFKVLQSQLGDMDINLEGHIADVKKPMGIDASFDIKLPRLSDISFLFPDRDLPAVPFTASGSLQNQQTRTHLDQVGITLGRISASIDGDLTPDNQFKLSIKAEGPDASVLDHLIGKSMPAESFSIVTDLAGNPGEFTLSGLVVYLGDSKVEGNLAIGLGEVKKFSGELNSPYLDISHWMAKREAEKTAPTPKPASSRQWMFPEKPVMNLTAKNVDINLDIQISTFVLENTTLSDIQFGFVLSHHFLDISPFTVKGTRGGRFLGELKMDGSGQEPVLNLRLSGKDVRTGLASAPGQDPATIPPVELEIDLEGVGHTWRDVASSLDGKVRAYVGSGQFAKAGLDLYFSDFLTQLFTTLNPFAKTSEYTQLSCAVYATTSTNGIVEVYPVIMQTEQLTILSEGTIDLHTEKLDLSFNTKPRQRTGPERWHIDQPVD